MEVFYYDGNAAQGMEIDNLAENGKGESEQATRIRTGGIPPGPGLLAGLAFFSTFLVPTTSNEMAGGTNFRVRLIVNGERRRELCVEHLRGVCVSLYAKGGENGVIPND